VPLVAIIAGASVALGVAAVVMATTKRKTVAVPIASTDATSQKLNQGARGTLANSLAAFADELRAVSRSMTDLNDRVQMADERLTSVEESFGKQLQESMANAQQVVQATLKDMEQVRDTSERSVRVQSKIADWRRSIVRDGVRDPNDMAGSITKMRSELQRAGATPEEVDTVIVQALEDYGVVDVQKLAETPISKEEVASTPEALRANIKDLRDLLYQIATVRGEVIQSAGILDDMADRVQRTNGAPPTREQLVQLFEVCRVRREELSEKQKALVPDLLVAVGAKPLTDAELQQYVWERRVDLAPLSPGQQLAMIQVLGRRVGNRPQTNGHAPSKAWSEEYARFAAPVVRDALRTADSMGRTSKRERETAALRALDTYLMTARVSATPEQKKAFIQTVLNETEEGATATATTVGGSGPNAASGVASGTNVEPTGAPIAATWQRDEQGRWADASGVVQAVTMPDGRVFDREGQLLGRWDGARVVGAPVKPGSTGGGGAAARPATATAPAAAVPTDPDRLQVLGVGYPTSIVGDALRLVATQLYRQVDGGDLRHQGDQLATVAVMRQGPDIAAQALRVSATRSPGPFSGIVLPQLLDTYVSARTLTGLPFDLPEVERSPDYSFYRAIIIGEVAGGLMRQPTEAKAALHAQQPRWSAWRPSAAILALTEQVPAPMDRLLVLRRGLGFGAASDPVDAELVQAMQQVQDTLRAAVEQLPPAATWRSNNQGLLHELRGQSLVIGAVQLVAAQEQGQRGPGRTTLALQQTYRHLLSVIAHDMTSARLAEQVLPRYAASLADQKTRSGVAGMERLSAYLREELVDLIAGPCRSVPDIAGSDLAVKAQAITDLILPEAERGIVIEVVLARIEPRIQQATELQGTDTRQHLLTTARSMASTLVAPPYGPARIDAWASAITRDLLSGGGAGAVAAKGGGEASRGGAPRAAGAPGAPAGTMPRVFPTPGMVKSTALGQSVTLLTTEGAIQRRIGPVAEPMTSITIPAGSYGSAHILNGVNAEVGGQGDPILLNFNYSWRGPNGSQLIMRNLRILCQVEPSLGTSRVRMTMSSLSYVFESGYSIFMPIRGFVVDDVDSLSGVPGELDLNLRRVFPYAAVSGFAKGLAETAAELSKPAPVIADSSAAAAAAAGTTLSNGDIIRRSTIAGLGEGVGSVDGYLQRIQSDLRPSVRVDNGRSVTVVVTDPVVFQVPDAEFRRLMAGSGEL
jgi:hypothetical protein